MTRRALALSALLLLATAARADAQAQRVTSEPAPVPAPEPPQPGPSVTEGADGVAVRSADGDIAVRLRALVQADGRFHLGDSAVADGFLIRRGRVELNGSFFGRFDFRLMPELAGASSSLLDAWVRWKVSPAFQVQAGKVKQPVGLERAQSREHSLFAELGYPTALVPNRDVGIDVQGELAGGRLAYYAGVFDGAADGASVVSDGDGERELAARLLATPIDGLGIGIGGTHGSREGSAPSSYRTVGQEVFFRWRDGVSNDGVAWRAVPQAYFHRGPLLLLGEYAVSSQELRAGPAVEELRATAWNASASWVLTGEDATYRGGVVPDRPVGAASNRGGAWQIAARATALEIDDDAFPVFADPARSARRAETFGLALSWYANRVVRVSIDAHHTELDGGPVEEEDVAILRAQLRF